MQSRAIFGVLLVAGGLALAGWHYRGPLMAAVSRDTPTPVASTTVLYSWTDQEGVVHYSQKGGKGKEKVVVDTGEITPVDELREPLLAQGKSAKGESGAASDQVGSEPAGQQPGHELMQVRDEIYRNAQKVHKRRMAEAMGEE